jgi:hypothetical protein
MIYVKEVIAILTENLSLDDYYYRRRNDPDKRKK